MPDNFESYVLLRTRDAAELSREVQKSLRDGWQLWGSPSIAGDEGGFVYVQAVVKPVKKAQHLTMPR